MQGCRLGMETLEAVGSCCLRLRHDLGLLSALTGFGDLQIFLAGVWCLEQNWALGTWGAAGVSLNLGQITNRLRKASNSNWHPYIAYS